jgi:hypothetical protein
MKLSEISSKVIVAHQRAAEKAQHVSEIGTEYTKAPSNLRAAAARAERNLGKTIKREHPNLSLQQEVGLRATLREHQLPHWKQD